MYKQMKALTEEIKRQAQQLWPRERGPIEDAAIELGVDLEMLAFELGNRQGQTVPLLGHYDLFVMFLKDSNFPVDWYWLQDSALNDISKQQLLIAFAMHEVMAAEDLFRVERNDSEANWKNGYECAAECVMAGLFALMQAKGQFAAATQQ